MSTRTALISATLVGMTALIAALDSCGGDASSQSGPELFKNQCSMCHLENAGGGPLAPSLLGKKREWTREKLITYLKDPPGYVAKDPRLKSQGGKFTLPMPTFKMLTDAQLGLLADHVLALP